MSVDSLLDFDLEQLGKLHPVLADADRIPHSSAQDATIDVGSYEPGPYRITANTTLSASFASTAPEHASGILMRGQIIAVQKVMLCGENIRAQVAGQDLEGQADAWCTLAIPASGSRFAVMTHPAKGIVHTVVRKRVRVLASASAEAATVCWLKHGEWVRGVH
jgi:hypothetical protein